MSLRRSAIVSNSLANCANSSSAAGSSRSRTDLTVTSTSIVLSVQTPLVGVNTNERTSPADAPRTASSKPGTMPSEPSS